MVVLAGRDPIGEIPVELDLAQAHSLIAAQQFQTAFKDAAAFRAQNDRGSTRALRLVEIAQRPDEQGLVGMGFHVRQHTIEGDHRPACDAFFLVFGGFERLGSAPYLDVHERLYHARGDTTGDGRGEIGRLEQMVVAQQYRGLSVQFARALFSRKGRLGHSATPKF